MPSRVAVLVTARPSWAKLAPVVMALQADPAFEVDLIGAAYALTHDRSGIVDPAFQPTTRLTAALDANTGESAALTTSLLALQLAPHLAQTRPALLLVMADRHETLAGTMAASYLGIPVLHLQGGEVSGNLDDRVRRANTALSDWHAVSNAEAYGRVISAGGHIDRVWITGCPSIDLCRLSKSAPVMTAAELSQYGTGVWVDPERPFTLVMMHASTEHPETAVVDFIRACDVLGPKIVFWPGADEGHDAVSKHLRSHPPANAKLVRSLPPDRFLRLLSQATYAVGNSSALIREASYFGIPRTILGDRQRGRAYTQHASELYGDGYAVPRLVELCKRACARAAMKA